MSDFLSAKQKEFRKSLLTKIHLSVRYKNYFASHTEEYRDLLNQHFNRTSCADLTINQLIAVLDYFNFKTDDLPDAIKKNHNNQQRKQDFANITQNQVYFIKNQWQRLARDPSDKALMAFIGNNNQAAIPFNLSCLTKKQASGVIAALRNMARQKAKQNDRK